MSLHSRAAEEQSSPGAAVHRERLGASSTVRFVEKRVLFVFGTKKRAERCNLPAVLREQDTGMRDFCCVVLERKR